VKGDRKGDISISMEYEKGWSPAANGKRKITVKLAVKGEGRRSF